ncbi:ferritin family protein [Chloroflexota bacterium]
MQENEQDKTLEGLKIAIQMEIDGKEYYLKVSKTGVNEAGRTLLASLSVEEASHKQKFEEIYNAIQRKKTWPITDFKPGGGERLKTIFYKATEKIASNAKNNDTELAVVQKAMDMENRTHDYYIRQSQSATYDTERRFYESVAAEERGHYLALLNYYEYLKDPESWFVKGEHTSLDGG